jgi:hypothetical protein
MWWVFYDQIIATDVESGTKGYYSLIILDGDKFATPGSSSALRIINIFAAFISKDWVFAIVNFICLVHLHVIIRRQQPWSMADFNPKSLVSKA